MHLRDYQQQLSDYIRGKHDNQPFNNAEVYRELMQDNIVNFLADEVPEIAELLAQDFEPFVLEFFKDWHCHSPHFYDIADEFRQYCQSLDNT